MELSITNSAFHGSVGNLLSNNVNNVNNNTSNYYYTSLHEFLSPLDAERRHSTIREKRTNGTGEWLLRSIEFKEWQASTQGTVFCCIGDPGVGKTYLACHVIENLRQEKNSAVCFVYCDYQDKERHTARNLLGSLLSQIIVHLDPRSDLVEQLRSRCQQRHSLSSAETTEFLRKAVSRTSKMVRLCLDAIDELDAEELNNILRSFAPLCQTLNVHIFLTGRRNAGIERLVNRRLANTASLVYFSISAAQTYQDMQCFLAQKLEDDTNPELVDNELRAKIFHRFAGDASTFLLASLNIGTLLKKLTMRERRECLDAYPMNLNETYERMLERIKNQDNVYGMRILHWVLFAMRPLNLAELLHALAICPNMKNLNPTEDLPPASVINQTLGLVTVDSPGYDGGIGIVRFVHFTLKNHLLANSSLHFPTGHTLLAEAALTYLQLKRSFVEWESAYPYFANSNLRTLYGYAVENWGRHVHEVEHPKLVVNVCKFLQCEGFRRIREFTCRVEKTGYISPLASPYFSPLHAASYFGLPDTLRRLLLSSSGMRSSLNTRDTNGITPLSCAAREGHRDIVEVLLDQGIEPSCGIETSWDPLAYGNIRVDINSGDQRCQTALSHAAERGHTEVVLLLLQQEAIDVNLADENGQTALSHASENGCTEVVELLLQREDINVNLFDKDGRTALSHSAEIGWTEIVKLLLRREDIDVNSADRDGRTALSHAADSGSAEVVKLLLQQENIDVQVFGDEGRIVLSHAARRGSTEVVKSLLRQEGINVNSADQGGRTALSHAAERGCTEVVRLLLQQEDIDINLADQRNGRTALSYAAKGGRTEVIKLLLQQEDINADAVDGRSRTALSHAAKGGWTEVVKLLLQREDIDINSADRDGRTALSHAAQGGCTEVARLLLQRESIDAEAVDDEGRTVLSHAARGGWTEIVELLLQREAIDVNSADQDGRTALSYAARGCTEVVRQLLQQEEIDVNSADNGGTLPLSYAAKWGNLEIVKLLLGRESIDLNSVDKKGRTALLHAENSTQLWRADLEEVICLLRDWEAPDSKSGNNRK